MDFNFGIGFGMKRQYQKKIILDTNVLEDHFGQSAGTSTQPITGMIPDTTNRGGNSWQDSTGQWWQVGERTMGSGDIHYCMAPTANNSEVMHVDMGTINYPITYTWQVLPYTIYNATVTNSAGLKFRFDSALSYFVAALEYQQKLTLGSWTFQTRVVITDHNVVVQTSTTIEAFTTTVGATWQTNVYYPFKLVDDGSTVTLYTGDSAGAASATTSRLVWNIFTTNNDKTKVGFYTNRFETALVPYRYTPYFDDLIIADGGI